jgi:hypothetical protein
VGKILAAILISTAGSILATLIWTQRSALNAAVRGQSRKVAGLWIGTAAYGPEPRHRRDFTCRLRQVGSFVYGSLSSFGERATDYELRGAIMESEYLHVTLRNKNPNVINYATGVLRIAHDCKHMKGHLVGRSRTLDQIVTGDLAMTRQD